MPLNVAMMICVKMAECIVRHVLTAWYVHHPAFFTVMVRTQKRYQIKTSLQWETNRINIIHGLSNSGGQYNKN